MSNPGTWLAAACVALAACRPNAPPIAVASVEELGAMPVPASVQGRDGGVSGYFDGRSVWVYGDTVATSAGTYPTTWRNNTMSWTTDLNASDGISNMVQPTDVMGAPREFFPRTQDEEAFNRRHVDRGLGRCAAPCGARYAIWGSAPVFDAKRRRALLSYGKVYSEPGEFNFRILGTSIAIWEDFESGPVRPRVVSSLADPTLLFDAKEGEFGIPVIAEHFLYLLACSSARDDSHACHLARAPLEDALRRTAYRFRTAKGWSEAVEDAAPLFEGSPNMTVHWNRHLGRWLAVYARDEKIVLRGAKALWGPWSEEVLVLAPRGGVMHAFAHAEFQERAGRVEYITYLAEQFQLVRVRFAGH